MGTIMRLLAEERIDEGCYQHSGDLVEKGLGSVAYSAASVRFGLYRQLGCKANEEVSHALSRQKLQLCYQG